MLTIFNYFISLRRLREAENMLDKIEDEHKLRTENINLQLQDRTSECARLKLDNEHIRVSKGRGGDLLR